MNIRKGNVVLQEGGDQVGGSCKMMEVSVSVFLCLLLVVLFSFFLGAAMHHWYHARKEYQASPGA